MRAGRDLVSVVAIDRTRERFGGLSWLCGGRATVAGHDENGMLGPRDKDTKACPRCGNFATIMKNRWWDHFPPPGGPREVPKLCPQSGQPYTLKR